MCYVGQKVIVLDDGKRRRPTYGVVRVVSDWFMVIEHKLWGYGEEQTALPHIYRKDGNGDWFSYQHEYLLNGVMIVLANNEYHTLCTNPTVEMWDNAFGKPENPDWFQDGVTYKLSGKLDKQTDYYIGLCEFFGVTVGENDDAIKFTPTRISEDGEAFENEIAFADPSLRDYWEPVVVDIPDNVNTSDEFFEFLKK